VNDYNGGILSKCSVIIVTHNSEKYLPKAIASLQVQTRQADELIIVDSGSENVDYLSIYRQEKNMHVIFAGKDIGFCRGNNFGMKHLDQETDYVFFLNPDAFLDANFIEQAISVMEKPAYKDVGALTGCLLGYDITLNKPTGKYDSTGVFCTWYGRWHDRAQATTVVSEKFQQIEKIPAICGAVFFCRKQALGNVTIRGDEVFDNTFYMYKEDVDLSLRLRKRGWKLLFGPELIAHHCRGWKQNRKKIPKKFRLCSARNELRIHLREYALIGTAYSFMKYLAVKVFDL